MVSPAPMPRFVALRFSSSCASSSSRRTSELACSATSFAVAPRPGCASVSRVCMASPVDELGDHDPGGERDAEDEERARPLRALGLRPLPQLRPGRSDVTLGGLLVLGRRALRAGRDQARLQLAQERGVVGELLGELPLDAAFGRCLIRHLLQAVRRLVDELVALAHFLTGGSSPVATRQIPEAAFLAAIVAAAASDA